MRGFGSSLAHYRCRRAGRFRFAPDRLAIEAELTSQAQVLGTWPPSFVTPLDEQHFVARLRAAITAHHRDVREDFSTAAQRLDETKTLGVIPAFKAPLAFGTDHGCAVLQSIRCSCQVARITRPKAMRYQANTA